MKDTAEFITSNLLTPCILVLLICTGIASFVFGKPIATALTFAKAQKSKKSLSDSLSAMLTALAGTLGVGNISGVALAIASGGCGAVFWMWISALFAMCVKYAEILLASHYRIKKDDGYHGGAPLYIRAAFCGNAGRKLSAFFAFLCIAASLTVGSSVQSGAAAEAAKEAFGIPQLLTGAVIALFAALCLRGGGKRISRVTDILVPLISTAYFILSLYIIVRESEKLPDVFDMILSSAFDMRAVTGGAGGYAFVKAMRFGVARGLISNEAGCGTAPFAHARADREPAEQGLFGIAEVFIDTVVLCTVTALSVILAYGGKPPEDVGGMVLMCNTFEKYLGKLAPAALCFSVVLFAFATVVCWYYYGVECLKICGAGRTARAVFGISFIVSTALGAITDGDGLWLISDICFDMMLAINTAAVLKELKTLKRIASAYSNPSKSRARDNAFTASMRFSRGNASDMPHSDTEAPKKQISLP